MKKPCSRNGYGVFPVFAMVCWLFLFCKIQEPFPEFWKISQYFANPIAN
jgi:hypothetical protein